MSWKVSVDAVVLTEGTGPEGYYHWSEVDMEFIPWLLTLPEVVDGREVRIDFTDDPHYFRIVRSGDVVRVAIDWHLVSYNDQHKSVWTQEVNEASTSLIGFIQGVVNLSSSLEGLTRGTYHNYPDEHLRKAFSIAKKTAEAYGLKPEHGTNE